MVSLSHRCLGLLGRQYSEPWTVSELIARYFFERKQLVDVSNRLCDGLLPSHKVRGQLATSQDGEIRPARTYFEHPSASLAPGFNSIATIMCFTLCHFSLLFNITPMLIPSSGNGEEKVRAAAGEENQY
jgi:hypothetical protein